jgi:hypothetical protein
MENNPHPTSNHQPPWVAGSRAVGRWILAAASGLLALVLPPALPAQLPPQIPPAFQGQLQVQQPAVDVSPPENYSATAAFDPPIVRVGQKTFYRVNVDAPETTFELPQTISAPAELKFGPLAHGQIARLEGNRFHPLATFLFEVQATATGHFTISNFTVKVAGQPVEIPAASVDVVSAAVPAASRRRLVLEASSTNLFLGEPFRLRVLSFAGDGNPIEALREVQFNGGGLMTDKISTRQMIEVVNHGGESRPAFVFETVATPIAAGALTVAAQGFTAGREFGGPIAISGQVVVSGGPPTYVFLTSEPLAIQVRPLPGGALPGFTGTMGKYVAERPQLSTNRLQVGEPVRLKTGYRTESNYTRFVPPELPRSRDWQIIPEQPPGSGFTLIPLTDEAQATPEIPFSGFDPVAKKYYDLTIPAVPVMVVGEGLPVQLNDGSGDENKSASLKLSGPAPTPGKAVASLKPLQLQGWFVGLQLLPVLGLAGLWRWDERRRFLAAHPEIVRRRKAKRDLRREKKKLQAAAAAGDAEQFGAHAADALRIAVAPHFPAESRALVSGDILTRFNEAERAGQAGEMVRKIFAAADAQFAAAPPAKINLLALKPELEIVLQQLEEKL